MIGLGLSISFCLSFFILFVANIPHAELSSSPLVILTVTKNPRVKGERD
jgi:hypothetical protein